MPDDPRASPLLDAITTRYEEFKSRLSRSLGSKEFAEEVLQEVYLKLHKVGPGGAAIADSDAYIYRVALNVATDLRRADARRLSRDEAAAALDLDEPMKAFGESHNARIEIEAVKRALDTLPAQQRDIFIAARIDGLSHEDIAIRYGITERTVQREIVRVLKILIETRKKVTLRKTS